MKRITYILFVMHVAIAAHGQQLDWLNINRAETSVLSSGLAIDNSSNVYVFGTFRDSFDINPGLDVDFHTPQGFIAGFIQKLDSNGDFLWGKVFQGKDRVAMSQVVFDEDDNIYIYGGFTDSVDLNPGVTEEIKVSNGLYDIFVVKLNTGGDYIWSRTIGSEQSESINLVKVGIDKRVYVAAVFNDTLDISLSGGSTNIYPKTNRLFRNYLIAKYSFEGELIWSENITASNITDIVINSVNDLYLVGYFSDSAQLDPNSTTKSYVNSSEQNGYILKLDSSGATIWLKTIPTYASGGSTNTDFITLDRHNNIIIAGELRDSADLDPGPTEKKVIARGIYTQFILKLNSDGDYQWVKWFGLPKQYSSITPGKIVSDTFNNLYITGNFRDSIDFDFDSGEEYRYGDDDIIESYCLKVGPNGEFRWVLEYGPSISDITLHNNSLYWVGNYRLEEDIDPTNGTNVNKPNGLFDSYVLKLNLPPNYIHTINTVSCDSIEYMGEKYLPPVEFEDYYYTSGGLDSLVIKKYEIGSLDKTVTQDHNTLTAQATGVDYQWLNCDDGYSEISGETDAEFTPTANGNYAVEITDGTCTDTSSCYSVTKVGVEYTNFPSSIAAYPNPTGGAVNIDLGTTYTNLTIKVYDALGKLVKEFALTSASELDLNLEAEAGVYYIHITNDNYSAQLKVLKQ